MLDHFRSASGSIWIKGLLLLLVLSFAVWGVGDMVQQTGRNVSIATVGSDKVTAQEFAGEYKRTAEGIRRMVGEHYTPEMLKKMNIPQQVLQALVNQKLFSMESAALQLIPGDADVVRQIRSNTNFQDKRGNFDKKYFEMMLSNNNLSEKVYVNRLRTDIAANLLVDTLLTTVPMSDSSIKTLLEARMEQRGCTLYTLGPWMVSEVAQPDDATIKTYYEQHPQEFTAPEYRKLSYVMLTRENIPPPAKITEEELRKAYDDRKDELKRPERRAVDQLLYASEEKATQAEELLKQGKTLAQVAKETDALNKDSLSLGKIERKDVIEGAVDAVFSLPVGKFTSPTQSPFGWHIFQVTAIAPPSVPSFEEVRATLETELSQLHNEESQSKIVNKLEDDMAAGSTLQEAAQALGLKVLSVGPVSKLGKAPDSQRVEIPVLDKFLETAFKTEDKMQSSLISSKGGKYYIVQVDSIVPERLRTLDEVKGLAAANWQKQKRAEQLNELAKTISGKFDTEAERNAVLAKYGMQSSGSVILKRSTRNANAITLPTEFIADAFAQNAGEATDAYMIEDGNYIIATVNRVIPMSAQNNDPKLVEQARKEIAEELEQSKRNEIREQYARYLADKYQVRINEDALQSVIK
jgi:peptidyl-prolyl cis-trans isomerase D